MFNIQTSMINESIAEVFKPIEHCVLGIDRY